MNRKQKSASVLSIITGCVALIIALILLVIIKYANWWGIVLFGVLAELAVAVLAIIAGTSAIKNNKWNFALLSAILGLFAFFPTAIASIILAITLNEEQTTKLA
jgi:hypothetical protein